MFARIYIPDGRADEPRADRRGGQSGPRARVQEGGGCGSGASRMPEMQAEQLNRRAAAAFLQGRTTAVFSGGERGRIEEQL